MPDPVDRIVLFPRPTAFIGTTVMYTSPMEVRAYARALLCVWMGTGLGGTSATVTFTVQQSQDLDIWTDGTPFTPSAAETEESVTEALYYPWMRVKAAVSGSDPGVTCWLAGEFVRREGA